jgi:hypothetical protein
MNLASTIDAILGAVLYMGEYAMNRIYRETHYGGSKSTRGNAGHHLVDLIRVDPKPIKGTRTG